MFRIVFNGPAIVAQLREASERLDDMKPVYEDIGEHLTQSHRQRFQQGVAPDGSAWAPKSPVTLEIYRRRGDRADPRPLIGPSGRLSTELSYLATGESVEFGSNLIYSSVMQTGAAKGAFGSDSRGRPIPWGNIPARVWLGLSDQDERDIIDITDEHLADAFRA